MSSKGKRSGIRMSKVSKNKEPSPDRSIEALGVSVIINNIFKRLSYPDLLNCSLVNKVWNDEARREIREHHVCVAYIVADDGAICRRLKDLEQDLCGMRVIPFNSMKITDPWHHTSSVACNGGANVWRNYATILATKWKRIELFRKPDDVSIESFPARRCGVVKMLNELIEANAGHLEEFLIRGLPRGLPNYLDSRCGAVMEGLAFHNLKTLKLGRNFNEMIDYFRGIKKDINFFVANLFHVAPNLEEILTMVESVHVEYLTDDFLKRCKLFKYCHPNTHDAPWYNKIIQARPKVTELVVESKHFNFRSHDVNSQSIAQFMNATCKDSLEKIQVDFIAAIILSVYATSSMPHVTEVTLSMNPKEIEIIRLISFIKLFFTKVFPNAKTVTINVEELVNVFLAYIDGFKTWIQCDAMEEFLERQVLRFSNVREPHEIHLLLKYQKTCRNNIGPTQSLLLASMCFNNVNSLTIDSHMADSINLELMWNSWPNLEKLTVWDQLNNIATKKDGFNIDATFCGISTEEASALRKLDDPKALHVVQTRPGLLSFQKLKRLNFKLKEDGIDRLNTKDLFLSKVTGHLVLEQMPDLEFTINGSNRLLSKLKHLKQFNARLEQL